MPGSSSPWSLNFFSYVMQENKEMLLHALQPAIYAHLLEVNCNMSIIGSFLNFDLLGRLQT